MNDIILHHYPTSPYAEKVRLAFGIKGLAWRWMERVRALGHGKMSRQIFT